VQTMCVEFRANTHTPNTNAPSSTECVCKSGTYLLNNNCATCSSGYYCDGTDNTQTPCPSDTYCDSGEKIQCSDFRSNTHNPNTLGSTSSECVCVPGMYLVGDTCNDCSANFYCEGSDNSQQSCPTKSNSPTSSDEETDCACNSGYFGSDNTPCVQCGSGTYKSLSRNSNCIECAKGKFSAGVAQTDPDTCEPCVAGKASDDRAASFCPECDPGKYSTGVNNNVCSDCGAGKWSADIAATTEVKCTVCDAGKYQTHLGAINVLSCFDCPVGKSKLRLGDVKFLPVNPRILVTGAGR